MTGIEEKHVNMSLHSSSRSKLTEFTFSNAFDIIDNEKPYKDEHPFVSSPSFGPKTGYSGYDCSSPSTKERNKILEMMNNLPESCQELSLKDIVIDHDVEKQTSTVDQKSDMKTGLKDRKTIKRERPISRSVSLDTGVFMLKMFNPISCGVKKSQSASRMSSNSNRFSNNKSNGSSHKSNNRRMSPQTNSRNSMSHKVMSLL
ncbi:hypothetical protein M8C21_023966 [Ambrosia artemisiifolia]|uniref:Uncharacterized protein n=1 Tax=Ambrosia artemisiifolia TaxID=4212 RepID=A0AAD5GBU9_AMBAR|nr:hypothetical protein M8C21_023966 [Ambrosia artemisiifolia]